MKIRPNTWDAVIAGLVIQQNEYKLPDDMSGMTVIDIGAHIGTFAIACAQRGAKTVLSVEAHPENFGILAQNLKEQAKTPGCNTELLCMHRAVVGNPDYADLKIVTREPGDHDGEIGRNTGHIDIFGTDKVLDNQEDAPVEDPAKDPAIIVSTIHAILGALGTPIDILKIDVEGAEWDIFDHIEADLPDIKMIVVELHAPPKGTGHPVIAPYEGRTLNELTTELAAKLRAKGFTEIGIVTTWANTLNFMTAKRSQKSDIQVNSKPSLLWVGDAGNRTGCSRVTESVCSRLVNLGWDVNVLGFGYNGDPHSMPFKIFPSADYARGIGGQTVQRLPGLIPTVRPDVVVLHDDHWNIGISLDSLALNNVWIPTVGYIAVDSENVRNDVAMQLRNLRHAICHTEFGVEQLKLAGFTGKTSVAGHGVDTKIYQPYDRMEARQGIDNKKDMRDAFIFGCVGINQPRKRLDLTVAYFAKWWNNAGCPPNAYLYMHTTNEGVWDLKQLADYCGVRGRLLSTQGGQSLGDDTMPTLYSAFDVLISTSEGESWGLPHLESMACGTPNLAVRAGGLPSWAGEAVYYVEPSVYSFTPNRMNTKRWIASETDFVAGMHHMYSDKELRDNYGKRGQDLAQDFTWDATAEHFDKILRQVVHAQAQAAVAVDATSEFQ